MKLEGETVQGVDLSGSAKLLDGKFLDDHPKHFAVKIDIPALQLEIFHTLMSIFLFTYVVPETPWLTASRADRNHVAVCPEERPEQVVGDFTLFKERGETLTGEPVTLLDGIYLQVKSFETFTIGDRVDCRISSMRFELREVVEKQVLLNLVRVSISNVVDGSDIRVLTAGLSPPRLSHSISLSKTLRVPQAF